MDGLQTSTLYTSGEDGFRKLTLPEFEYAPLVEEHQRFFVLYPAKDSREHVRCDLETLPLYDAPLYIAVKNARGYRFLEEPIEVNGKGLIVAAALEMFLRQFREHISEPTRLWTRYLCLELANDVEKTTYWNRDFSDVMYAMASDVVDMSEFNAELVDQGVIKPGFDSRYSTWSKKWYGMPETAVLPKVYPIRLGANIRNPKMEPPVADYEYNPLDMVADEIRVVVIVPSKDPASGVVLDLAHCPIVSEVTYSALSYRWGNDTSEEMLVVNGQRKQVRKNLLEALRAIRQPEHLQAIWIDAISINQHDVLERSRQVPRMGRIFDRAVNVLCYIGPETEDSDLAMELIKELQQPTVRINSNGEWHFGDWGFEKGSGASYGENRIKPARLAMMCAALYKLLTREYFRRAWILQEAAFASNPIIGIGDRFDTSFDQLDMAVYNFESMLLTDPTLATQMRNADSSLEDISVHELAFPRKLFYLRHLVSDGAPNFGIVQFAEIALTSPGLLETLILARDFECSDTRDKLVSIWNIAQDKDGLEFRPDYTKSTRETYMLSTRAWIKQKSSLDILGAVEASTATECYYRQSPSWCPDWSVPATASCLVRRDRIPNQIMSSISSQDGPLYYSDGESSSGHADRPFFRFDGDHLCCTGVILDEIKTILDEPPEIPHGAMFPFGCDPRTHWLFENWTQELVRCLTPTEDSRYDDVLQAATAMMHGDCVAAWPERNDNVENCSRSYPEEVYICRPEASRYIPRFGASYDRTTAWSAVATILRGRRPFVTESGYMGLVPSYACISNSGEKQRPWQVAIVAGCSVPLLLRERDDGYHELCGSTFVQGWMEGEWLHTMMGANNAREFWSTVDGSAMLRIS